MTSWLKRRNGIEALLAVVVPLVCILAWEALAQAGWIDDRFWPPPSVLVATTFELVGEGELLADIRISLIRILVGFVLGAVPGIVFGLLMGLFWPLRALLMPVAAAIYAVPKIALLPLVLLVFGTDETGKYVIVGISIFFLVMLNTMAGVLQLDPIFRDVAQNFGARPFALFWTVALPGSMPATFTGLRLGLGFALIVIVGTEYVQAREGLGRFIYDSYQILAIPNMFVGLVVTGLLGWLLTAALGLVERVALPWQPDRG